MLEKPRLLSLLPNSFNKFNKTYYTVPRRYLFSGAFMFLSILCWLCLCTRLFICALWSPAGKELTSWLSFAVYYCECVTFPLVSWFSVVLDCIDS